MSQADLLARRERVLANHKTFYYDVPLHIVRGEGVRVWDSDGRRYLDCYNNVVSVGHCHPVVVNALAQQAATLNTHTRYLHENVVELCEKLGRLMPGDLDVCFIVCTGTEANDLAVQIARAVTGRRGVIASESSYHGNSSLVNQFSLSDCPEPLREDWVGVVEPPNTYTGPYRDGQDDNCAALYAADVDAAIERLERAGHGTAAMVVDTIWDSNGVLLAPPGYLEKSAAAVQKAGGLLIVDEVQAGYCRTGKYWWGFQHYGVRPDIVTLGKPMGNGHPVAGLVMSRDIAERYAASPAASYFNTFGGNPVSAAVASAVIEVIESEGLLARVADVGDYLAAGLFELSRQHEMIGQVRGRGLFWGLDLVEDRATRQPVSAATIRRLTTELAAEGVLMGSCGRFNNVLKIRPPLVFSRDNADEAIEAIDRVLNISIRERNK